MSSCAAFGCTNRPSKKIPGVTFHKFPVNPARRRQWILAVRRKNWHPSRHSTLCSNHFTEDMMDRTSTVLVRLRENAVPSIFHSNKKNMPSMLSRKQLINDENEDDTAFNISSGDNAEDSPDEPSNSNLANCIVTLNSVLRESSSKATQPEIAKTTYEMSVLEVQLQKIETKLKLYKKKIKNLNNKTERNQVKIDFLKKQLKDVKQKKFLMGDIIF